MPLPAEFADLVTGEEFTVLRTARDFNAIAAVLNTPTERGPVPIEVLASYCCRKGVTGAVMAILEIPVGGPIAPGVAMTLPLKGMLHTVLTLIQLDYRLTTADLDDPAFGAAVDGLVGLGVMTADQRAEVMALGDARVGRAELILGRPCTGTDCLAAAGGN